MSRQIYAMVDVWRVANVLSGVCLRAGAATFEDIWFVLITMIYILD